MPIKLRPALRCDMQLIARIQRAAFCCLDERLARDAERELGRTLSAPGSACYMIMYMDRPAGYVRVARYGEMARISPIFVAPEYWRRGIGTRALNYMRAIYPDAARWSLSTLASCEANRAFYISLGYRLEGYERPLMREVEVARYALCETKPVRPELAAYVRRYVLPKYAGFDEGHDEFHALSAIGAALELARALGEDVNLAYAAAACHDLGLEYGRADHQLRSGELVRADARLHELLGRDALERVARACEDHRASGAAPRELLGRIIADADRELEPRRLTYRTLSYGLARYSELDDAGQIARALEHMRQKYGQGGYMRLWLDAEPVQARLSKLRALLKQPERMERMCREFLADMRGG